MNKLTETQIEILTKYYTRSFDAWEAWGNLYDAFEKHGNQKKIIFTELYVNTWGQL